MSQKKSPRNKIFSSNLFMCYKVQLNEICDKYEDESTVSRYSLHFHSSCELSSIAQSLTLGRARGSLLTDSELTSSQ